MALGVWGMGVRGINQGYHTEIAFKTLHVLTSSPFPKRPDFPLSRRAFLVRDLPYISFASSYALDGIYFTHISLTNDYFSCLSETTFPGNTVDDNSSLCAFPSFGIAPFELSYTGGVSVRILRILQIYRSVYPYRSIQDVRPGSTY